MSLTLDLSHEGFSQLIKFQQERETYEFKASVMLHNEALVLGNT